MSGEQQPFRGAVVRQEFDATEVTQTAETAATAVAARAQAEIQARYIVAMRQPRDIETVRVRLLTECKRPGFAAVARYRKPIGTGVEGPSIRFAETAIRCMGNIYADSAVVYEDAERRIIRVSVTDAEGNIAYSTEIAIDKTVERKTLKPGTAALRVRKNSKGETIYLVPGTEDDILNKQNALISKSLRTNGLRLLPGDLLEDAMAQVLRTLHDEAARDPDAEKRRLIDGFAALEIQPDELRLYLGHDLDRVAPTELVELRQVYAAIRDGETTWEAIMSARVPAGSAQQAAEVAEQKIAELTRAQAGAMVAIQDAMEARIAASAALQAESIPEVSELPDAMEGPERVLYEGNIYVRNEQRTAYMKQHSPQAEAPPPEAGSDPAPAQPAPRPSKPKFGQKG